MKVGIITFQDSYNYGATLQCYALWKYISDKGHNCEVIRLYRPPFDEYKKSQLFKPLREKEIPPMTFLHWLKIIIFGKKAVSKEYDKNFRTFNELMTFSKPYYKVDDLYKSPPLYDLYITGSDQVWNPSFGYCMEPYFLTFAPNGRTKISYASSIGIDELLDYESTKYAEWLSSYKAISVRESTGKKILESLGLSAEVVCDPCMLLGNAKWTPLAVEPQINKPYILLYMAGKQSNKLIQFAEKISNESGMPLVYLNRKDDKDFKGIIDSKAGPKEFIGYFRQAEMTITNSFHATIFSIMMGTKRFFAYIPEKAKRGSRIKDLLNILQLDSCILPSQLEIDYEFLKHIEIDRKEVSSLLEKHVAHSKNFIDQYI